MTDDSPIDLGLTEANDRDWIDISSDLLLWWFLVRQTRMRVWLVMDWNWVRIGFFHLHLSVQRQLRVRLSLDLMIAIAGDSFDEWHDQYWSWSWLDRCTSVCLRCYPRIRIGIRIRILIISPCDLLYRVVLLVVFLFAVLVVLSSVRFRSPGIGNDIDTYMD